MLIIVGFLFSVLLFVLVGGVSRMLAFFVDIPSALLILLPLIFFLVASKSGTIAGGYITSSFKKGYVYSQRELENIVLVMKRLVRFVLAVGGFGFIAGIIGSLANIGTPERLGPNLAVSLITLVYSVAVSYFVFFPVQVWAENKKALLEKPPV
jgi:flagellar motor component MotA